MNMFDLATELEQIEVQRRIKLFETTTMDAVSFIPAHLGAVRAKVKDLAKRKWKWGLEILEDDNGNKDVRIEDALRITVPKEHWNSFQEMFVGDLNNDSYLNLKSLLNEALEDELKDLRDDLKPALHEMYNEQRFASLDKTIKVWQSRFGISKIITNKKNVAVTVEHKGKDIQRLYGKLIRVYEEDKGGLEMLLNDIKSNRPLSAYDIFKDYGYLYGVRLRSKLHDIFLIFEAAIDMTFATSQSIYISEEEVLDEVEDQIISVKRVGNVLYPSDERFSIDFFNSLYNIIEEVMEEQEKQEKQEGQKNV